MIVPTLSYLSFQPELTTLRLAILQLPQQLVDDGGTPVTAFVKIAEWYNQGDTVKFLSLSIIQLERLQSTIDCYYTILSLKLICAR